MGRFWLPSKENLGEFKSLQSAMVEAEKNSWQPGRQGGSRPLPPWLAYATCAVAASLIFAAGYWCGATGAAGARPPIAERATQLPSERQYMEAKRQQGITQGPAAPKASPPAIPARNVDPRKAGPGYAGPIYAGPSSAGPANAGPRSTPSRVPPANHPQRRPGLVQPD